jgi:hypothetical protein
MPQWPEAQLPLTIHRGDASRVVAAVFQLAQTLQQQEGRFPGAHEGDDSANGEAGNWAATHARADTAERPSASGGSTHRSG